MPSELFAQLRGSQFLRLSLCRCTSKRYLTVRVLCKEESCHSSPMTSWNLWSAQPRSDLLSFYRWKLDDPGRVSWPSLRSHRKRTGVVAWTHPSFENETRKHRTVRTKTTASYRTSWPYQWPIWASMLAPPLVTSTVCRYSSSCGFSRVPSRLTSS